MLTSKLASTLENSDVINAGVSGNNTSDTVFRIEKEVMDRRSDCGQG